MLTSQEFSSALRMHGYKVTPQRLAVYEALANTRSHPNAEALFQQLQLKYPSMSFATVYKTIEILQKLHLIQVLNLGEDSYRYDADTTPHHHLQCTCCGRVEDITLADSSFLIQQAEAQSGYALQGHLFYFFGLCPDCSQNN